MAGCNYFISKLALNKTVGIVLDNGSMSSDAVTEGQIRKVLIENDLVERMVALPSQLFTVFGSHLPKFMINVGQLERNIKFHIKKKDFGYHESNSTIQYVLIFLMESV